MRRFIILFQRFLYLFLVVSIVSVTTAQTSTANDLTTSEQVQNNITYVDKQELTAEELVMLDNASEDIDQITAGHRPVPVPVRHGIYTSDVLFWAGFSLIMLSLAIYPY